jgi:hypothetical protein
LIGGGGGGGSADLGGGIGKAAGGGGSGGYAEVYLNSNFTGVTGISFTIGAGGPLATPGGNNGGPGNSTTLNLLGSFGTSLYVTCTGGGGGGGADQTSPPPLGAAGAAGSVTVAALPIGVTNVTTYPLISSTTGNPGSSGRVSIPTTVYAVNGGNGGASVLGSGGIGAARYGSTLVNSSQPGLYGGGGGGGAESNTGFPNILPPSAGGNGVVIVTITE